MVGKPTLISNEKCVLFGPDVDLLIRTQGHTLWRAANLLVKILLTFDTGVCTLTLKFEIAHFYANITNHLKN